MPVYTRIAIICCFAKPPVICCICMPFFHCRYFSLTRDAYPRRVQIHYVKVSLTSWHVPPGAVGRRTPGDATLDPPAVRARGVAAALDWRNQCFFALSLASVSLARLPLSWFAWGLVRHCLVLLFQSSMLAINSVSLYAATRLGNNLTPGAYH